MSRRFKHLFEKVSDKHFFSWKREDGTPDPDLIEFVRHTDREDRWEPTAHVRDWLAERNRGDDSIAVVATGTIVVIRIADHDLAFEFKMKYC